MTFKETLEEIFCVYKSTRFIRVRNYRLATVYYSCLILVLLYIILYTIWWDRGYQATDPVTGTTSCKIKGTASAQKPNSSEIIVYDAMDLIVPAIEENAFFVTTSMILTPNQSRDTCPGNKDVAACDNSNYTKVCIAGTYNAKSQGIYTGNCCSTSIENNGNCSSMYEPNDRCEVASWCPLEVDSSEVALNMTNVGVWTAFIKVDVAFSAFNKSRTNTLDVNHDHSPAEGYNLFSINDIVRKATYGEITNVTAGSDISTEGAIILMESNWDCNFDKGDNACNLTWNFHRIDSEPNTVSKGFNFRAVTYDVNMEKRMLRKMSGIRVVFTTTGTGSQFSFAQLTVTFGAGLAYLGAAAFITDIVLEKFLPQSKEYVRMKNRDDNILLSMKNVNGNANADYHDLSLSTNDHLNTGLLGNENNQDRNGQIS